MGLFINTNGSALNAQRQLSSTTNSLSTSFERLSSGLRINGAKDDAAGLSITTRFSSQISLGITDEKYVHHIVAGEQCRIDRNDDSSSSTAPCNAEPGQPSVELTARR